MNVLERLRERFWFLPTVLCLLAVVLAEVLIAVDRRLGTLPLPGWVEPILHAVGESGSRDILGAIAGSSLAVAGTTFSITIAVLALTSSTYGPRLIRNFMADSGNQVVLGVFVATFLYSLIVLRSIRAIGDPGDPDAEVFVPHLSVNVAVLLGVLNVAVLVYFIHHISDSIQISTIAGRARGDLRDTVRHLYPEKMGRDAAQAGGEVGLPERLAEEARPVRSGRTGYVGFLQGDALVEAAADADVLLALQVRPGDYVLEDTVVCLVHPPGRMSDSLADTVSSAVGVSGGRSPHQDIAFAVQQLVELAVRALSPSTNDPFTAANALNDLTSGLSLLAEREAPSAGRFDAAGRLRVHAPFDDAVSLTSYVLDHVRWYAADHPAVMDRALTLAGRVGEHARSRPLPDRLVTQVRLLIEAFESADHQPHDVEVFTERAEEVLRGLARV